MRSLIFSICLVVSFPLLADVRISFPSQPNFYTCVNNIPIPATAGPGIRPALEAKIRRYCPGSQKSGKIMVFKIGDSQDKVAANKHVVQTIRVNHRMYKIDPATNKCTRKIPTAYVLPEYWLNTTNMAILDHHVGAECCEMRIKEKISAHTAIMAKPAGARPPIPGFGGAGYAYTTAAQRDNITKALKANAEAKWGYRYEYDGCHNPPKTTSGTTHYLKMRLSYPGGPSGAIVHTQ